MDKMITVTVPIVVKGEPKGVKLQGGVLDFLTARSRSSACRPRFPSTSTSTSELMIGQACPLSDVAPTPSGRR